MERLLGPSVGFEDFVRSTTSAATSSLWKFLPRPHQLHGGSSACWPEQLCRTRPPRAVIAAWPNPLTQALGATSTKWVPCAGGGRATVKPDAGHLNGKLFPYHSTLHRQLSFETNNLEIVPADVCARPTLSSRPSQTNQRSRRSVVIRCASTCTRRGRQLESSRMAASGFRASRHQTSPTPATNACCDTQSDTQNSEMPNPYSQ